jgi:hypothetical protein
MIYGILILKRDQLLSMSWKSVDEKETEESLTGAI